MKCFKCLLVCLECSPSRVQVAATLTLFRKFLKIWLFSQVLGTSWLLPCFDMILLLMKPRMAFAFCAAASHQWLTFTLWFTKTSRSFSHVEWFLSFLILYSDLWFFYWHVRFCIGLCWSSICSFSPLFQLVPTCQDRHQSWQCSLKCYFPLSLCHSQI